ncbi:transketolase [bacterium]|nr:transketolase [bacterium]
MRDHFIKRFHELAVQDPRLVLITGDLGFGVFDRFREERSDQFINAGVSEQNMTMLATGMAIEGRIAFTYSIGNFPTLRCLEMIRNDAAYHDANVKVVCIGGGFSYGALGISHHATEDLAIMRSLPSVNVLAPCGLWEAMEATEAIVKTSGTCYLRLDKSHGDDLEDRGGPFVLGKMRKLRDGSDATVVVTGGILCEVQKAANDLASRGIRIRILSCHSLKPFDHDALAQAAVETGGIVTVEEHTIDGGLGSIVSESLMDRGILPKYFLRIGLEAGFSSIVGSQEYLRAMYQMDSNAIRDRIAKLLC